jgi:hypothetical protein
LSKRIPLAGTIRASGRSLGRRNPRAVKHKIRSYPTKHRVFRRKKPLRAVQCIPTEKHSLYVSQSMAGKCLREQVDYFALRHLLDFGIVSSKIIIR